MLPIAGDQITNDVAVALRTPTQAAEEIKKKFAYAMARLAPEGELIDTPSVGDRAPRKLALSQLVDVVEPRAEELFLLVQDELRRSAYEDLLGAGIVLTGGSSKMEGMVELAEEVFQLPVRLGVPHYTGTLMCIRDRSEVMRSPIYATGIGLLLFGHQYQSRPETRKKVFVWADQPIQRMRSWFTKYFTEE